MAEARFGTNRHLERLADLLTGATQDNYDLETNDVALHFSGVNAKGADLAALEQAKKQAESGTPMKEVWRQTGWYQAPWDGKWRTWLDHGDTNFASPTMTFEVYQPRVKSSIYKDYPQIKDTNAFANISPFVETPSGYYEPKSNVLAVQAPTQELANSFGYHELQHKIADIEGFSLGAGPEHPIIKDAVEAYKASYPKEYAKLKSNPRIAELLEAANRPLDDYLQHQLYTANAGEAEARLAQAWRGKSLEEAKKHYPLDELPAFPESGMDMSTAPKVSPDFLWREGDTVEKLADILLRLGKQKTK